MEDQKVSFETAKLAKEKGFRYYCEYSYWKNELTNFTPGYADENGITTAGNYDKFERYYVPTQTQLQKWLREVHHIEIFIKKGYGYEWYIEDTELGDGTYNTYEEALEIGLQEALKII